jgi:predicted nucleic acid-binding protein
MRVVVDTCILVQAMLHPAGSLELVLRRLWDDDFTLLFSNAWLDGLVDILAASEIPLRR